jgi:hypothetical protein
MPLLGTGTTEPAEAQEPLLDITIVVVQEHTVPMAPHLPQEVVALTEEAEQ